ncbi:MAG: alpha-galactosidase, partial [Muribaculaceae bacterium]
MIKRNQLSCIMGGLCLLTQTAFAANLDISEGNWEIKYDQATKNVDYIQSGKTILADVFVKAKNAAGIELLSSTYTNVELKKEAVQDNFGAGNKYTYTYKTAGKETLEQVFYFYTGRDYLLTEAYLLSDNSIGINWISPLMTQSVNEFLPTNGDYRILDMPFDNDSFRGYSAQTWSIAKNGGTSCEASAIYDVTTRNGLVVGSVEHSTWKTGVFYQTSTSNKVRELRVFGGLVDARTNDVRPEKGPVVTEHGKVFGKRIKSPKIFVGYFNDWRNGMDKYGEANAIVAPKLPWDGGTIFGWQSWGGMAERVNYEGACNVSDFFATDLSNVKNEQGTVYMILDSFWDNMTETQLRNFVKRCKKNGQIPGIYFCPFSFWGGENDLGWKVNGSDYTYNDIVLRA